MRRASVWVAAVFPLVGGACVDIAMLDGTATVRALWDPTTSTLPKPTDLVRNPDLGQLELPLDPDLPAAELELRQYLNGLDGYPLSTPISIPLEGAVDPATLAGNLLLVDVDSNVNVNVDIDARRQLIKVTPQAGVALKAGHRFLYALRGYDGGVRGVNGEPVIADAAFSFLRSTEPLTEHLAAMPGQTMAEKRAAADSLEPVRLGFQPWFDELLRRDWPQQTVAVLGSYTTTSLPAVWFDPISGQVPLPNNLLLDRSTGLVDLPIDTTDSEEIQHLRHMLNTYDGFSTTAALIVAATHSVDRDTVTLPGAIRLFRVDDGSFAEINDLERGVTEDGTGFWIRPRLTLEENARYVYVVTRLASAAGGAPLEAQVFGALVRSQAPVLLDGRSQVGALSDDEAARVEPTRAETVALLDHLDAQGLRRHTLAAAVPFQTLSTVQRLLDWRAKLYTRNVPTGVANIVDESPFDRGLFAAMPFVETVISGTLTTLDRIDPYTSAFYDDGGALERDIEFLLTIPRSAEKGKALPVVLFGHGLMTSRELVYLIADRLARGGYAVMSIDLALHGERAICRQDIECAAGATCAADGVCINADGSRGAVRAVQSPLPDWPILPDIRYPITSGSYFIDPNDLVGTRDHFIQSSLDMMQTLRVIRGADWSTATDGYVLAGDDVVYLGMSLGGILGGVLSGVEPTVETFVLNVPGADFVTMITDSTLLQPIIDVGLQNRGIERGTAEYFRFENAAGWLMDIIDPVNIAHHATLAPITYVDPVDGLNKTAPPKRVLIQMAEGDIVVPNSATAALAERMQQSISEYSPLVSNHAFLFDPTSFEGAAARTEMVEFFDAR